MSLIANAASPLGSLFYHPTRRGLNSAVSQSGGSAPQSPASTTSLFGTLLHSVEQVMGLPVMNAVVNAPAGISGAAASPSPAAGATGPSATAPAANASPSQQVQSFVYSLFQALKADGLGVGTASGAASGSGGAGQYAASLTSSLQTLIQQVGSGGTAIAPVANLDAAFNNLIGAASPAAGSNASAATASTAGLQRFLGNLLQSVQSTGPASFAAVGSNVNAKV